METTTLLPNASEAGSSRLDHLDIAKGILIISVVLMHTWFANFDILGDFLPFAMPTFFFLAGYTHKTGRGYGKNLGRRAVKLLLPYVCFCTFWTLMHPVYNILARLPLWQQTPVSTIWFACFRADGMNMLMSTPMWFLVALFTASVLFFLVADKARESWKLTVILTAVFVGIALVLDVIKHYGMHSDAAWWWFWDYAPFGTAMMLLGSYAGNKGFYQKLTPKSIVIGLICLVGAMLLNIPFWGSARTVIVKYLEGGAWYGVLTAFVIAVAGTVGILCVSRLLQQVPGLRKVLTWLGRNTLWILCIHYGLIMMIEMWLFNHNILKISIFDVITNQLYAGTLWARPVHDTPTDVLLKIMTAALSIVISGVFAVIQRKISARIRSARSSS